MKLLVKLIIAAVLVAAGAIGAIWITTDSHDDGTVTMQRSTIGEIRSMVQLCPMEIYDEVPMHGSIGTRHIFARVLLQGSINFDIEQLRVDTVGDTLRVVLPPEIVELRESTEPGAYTVIDTWNTRLLGSSAFTTAEENAIKRRMVALRTKHLYTRGYVRRARSEAAANLRVMLENVYHRPVKVTDPTPNGTRQR